MKKLYTSRTISLLFIFLMISVNSFSQFATSYDSRAYYYVTSVKDQAACGACWAFASCAAIESSWLRNGYGSYDLSEDNLIDCHNFDPNPCEWGKYYMTQAILSLHKGIYSEAQDAYTPNLQNCPLNSTFPPDPQAYVEEIRFIPGTTNEIKQAILDYGAVATTMYMNYNDPSSWDGTNYKYYDNSITLADEAYAHCVTIVGWNDNYTFTGAPGNGGWIIKDSYGTTWADNGYFYCSYHDVGILGTNVVFPTKQAIPDSKNTAQVYSHDEFGWVDNYGFGTNTAYALTKYTLTPAGGNMMPQQIKRIGSYAISDNTTIDIEIYRTFNGNVLSDLITSTSINCPVKGFYTKDIFLKTDLLNSTIYIKTKYTCSANSTQAIPIEKMETASSSAFQASHSACWISASGNTWIPIGQGTNNDFDLCIKMYTENAPYASMEIIDLISTQPIGASVCETSHLEISNNSMILDSLEWYIDDVLVDVGPAFTYLCNDSGTKTFKLIEYYGNNLDISIRTVNIIALPSIPIVTQINNTLESSTAYSYQWLNDDFSIIPGEINQSFTPLFNGLYHVEVRNSDSCSNISESFNFISTHINKTKQQLCQVYPNPTNNLVHIEFSKPYFGRVQLISMEGLILKEIFIHNEQRTSLNLSKIQKGIYLLKAQSKKILIIKK